MLWAAYSLRAQNDAAAEIPADTTAQLKLGLHLQPYFRWSNEKRIPGGLEFYNFDRYNSFSVNSAVLRLDYTSSKVRSSLGLVSGSYAVRNYAQEPPGLQNVYEASVGLKLSKKQNWWLDMGVLPGHLGWESVYGMDNLNLSRSFYSEYTPYYQTGARLSHISPSGRWSWSVLALNGWQNISTPDTLSEFGFGYTLKRKWKSDWELNFNGYYGRRREDRYPNFVRERVQVDLWTRGTLGTHWELAGGLAFGLLTTDWRQTHLTAQTRYSIDHRWFVNARLEIFGDEEFFVDPDDPFFENNDAPYTYGFSLGLDYQFNNYLMSRFEYRVNLFEYDLVDVHGLIYSLEFNLEKDLLRLGKK